MTKALRLNLLLLQVALLSLLAAAHYDREPTMCSLFPRRVLVNTSQYTMALPGGFAGTVSFRCFTTYLHSSVPSCASLLQNATVALLHVSRSGTTEIPIAALMLNTSTVGSIFRFTQEGHLYLQLRLPQNAARCAPVEWMYDFDGSMSSQITSTLVPHFLRIAPRIAQTGAPTELHFGAITGGEATYDLAYTTDEQPCSSQMTATAQLQRTSGTSTEWMAVMQMQQAGGYRVCMRVGGAFLEVGRVHVYSGNPSFFRAQGLIPGGFYEYGRRYTIEFYGTGLNTMPQVGDRAKFVPMLRSCEHPAVYGIPEGTDLGPSDLASTDVATWDVQMYSRINLRVCYYVASLGQWATVVLYERIPRSFGNDYFDANMTVSTPTEPRAPTNAPTAPPNRVPATLMPTTVPPRGPLPAPAPASPAATAPVCAFDLPSNCDRVESPSARLVLSVRGPLREDLAAGLAALMCLPNAAPLSLDVDSQSSDEHTITVTVMCNSATCQAERAITALLCQWRTSRANPSVPAYKEFQRLGVVSIGLTTSTLARIRIDANTEESRRASLVGIIVGAAVAGSVTLFIIIGVTIICCRRRRQKALSTSDPFGIMSEAVEKMKKKAPSTTAPDCDESASVWDHRRVAAASDKEGPPPAPTQDIKDVTSDPQH